MYYTPSLVNFISLKLSSKYSPNFPKIPPPPLEFRISINWNISTGNGRNRKTGVSLTIQKTRDRARIKGWLGMRAIYQRVKRESPPSIGARSHSSKRAREHTVKGIVHICDDRSVRSVRSRVTRLARTGSKYKYVIRRNEGACVTEHLPRARGPRPCPKEDRLKRRVLWDKEKVWRTGSCTAHGDVGPPFCLAGVPIT